uniref:Uncharacterized protein n=1 Tax=Arundo donax TaxID=35708 RepID=A0A0A9E9H5_ARUDO
MLQDGAPRKQNKKERKKESREQEKPHYVNQDKSFTWFA